MPRTRITDDQILDQAFVTEAELNEFFSTVVVTGTEDASVVLQTFDQYFPGRNLITAGSNITVITGTNFVQINSTGSSSVPKAIVGDSFISVVTGTDTINLSADAIIGGTGISVISGTNTVTITNTGSAGSVPNAIVGDSFISVVTGTNTTNLSADAIIAGNSQITISSGTNSVSIFGRVPDAIVGGADISVVSGTGFIIVTDNNRAIISNNNNQLVVTSGTSTITLAPVVDKAIIGDSFVSVVTGTSTINLSADAIVGIDNNIVVISGASTVTASGVVTVTSGIGYINDTTRGGKSLSVYRTSYYFGFDGNVDNAYLKIGDVVSTADGIPLYRPGTITAISGFYAGGAATKDYEVRKNGVATSIRSFTLTLNTRFIADSENINLDAGDYLQVFATNAGGGAADTVVSIEVAWRLL